MTMDGSGGARQAAAARAALGAATFALWEVARITLGARLALGPVAVMTLAVLALVTCLAAGLIAGAVLAALPGARRVDRVGAGVVGAFAGAGVSLGATLAWRAGPYLPVWHGGGAWWGGLTVAVALPVLVAMGLAQLSATGQRRAALALAVVGSLSLWWVRVPAPAPASGPRVLLITLDGSRTDVFSDARVDTAAVDRLGREGVRFVRTYAQVPYTGPSYVGLHTGSGPWEHGVWLDGVRPAPEVPTLAEVLRDAGWDTGAFIGSARFARGAGLERGFRVYDDDFAFVVGARHLPAGKVFGLLRRGDGAWPTERRADEVVDRAVRWMARRTGPYFAWVQLGEGRPPFAPPHPFDVRYAREGGPPAGAPPQGALPVRFAGRAPPGASARWLRSQYEGAVASADHQIARLLERLDTWGLAQDTIVVFTSPHGLTLGEEGRWWTHAELSDAELHVPLVARWPEGLPAGRIVREPVEISDVAPTILTWVGVDPPASWGGVSAVGAHAEDAAGRSVARSLAFRTGSTGERWRASVVRNRSHAWLHLEDPGHEDAFSGGGAELDPTARALLGDLMSSRARDLLGGWGPADVRRPEVPRATAGWLEAQGAHLAP